MEVLGFFDCLSRNEVVDGECGELLREERELIAEDNTLARPARVEQRDLWRRLSVGEVSNDAHAGSDTNTTRDECEVQRERGVGVEKTVRERGGELSADFAREYRARKISHFFYGEREVRFVRRATDAVALALRGLEAGEADREVLAGDEVGARALRLKDERIHPRHLGSFFDNRPCAGVVLHIY